MDALEAKLNAGLVQFVNGWLVSLQEFCWPAGVIFGIVAIVMWLNKENILIFKCLIFVELICIAYQPVFVILLPKISLNLTGQVVKLPDFYIQIFFFEFLLVTLLYWILIRYGSQRVDQFFQFFTLTNKSERNKKTDIRNISSHVPEPKNIYNPKKFINPKKGIFIGVDEKHKPVYIPHQEWSTSHISVSGSTGYGKGIFSGLTVTQSIKLGEAVIVMDPKGDEWLPHVLQAAASEAGVDYCYIDLNQDLPVWNPIQNKNEQEIEELLAAGFSLGETGTDADFYRLDDRRASRFFAKLIGDKQLSIIEAFKLFIEQHPDIANLGKKFSADIEEIGLVQSINTSVGIDIETAIEAGAVIYVKGSMRNPRIDKLQRIFVISVIQFIEKRNRDFARQVLFFLDEFKYLVSKPTLEALGTVRDKKAHLILNYQTLGDLKSCPKDMNPDSVIASVNENCSIKVAYSVNDPDTSEWLAKMSGEIMVDDEIKQVKANWGLTEVRDKQRTLRQSQRYLIDTNMIQSLPQRCAIVYGVGLAKFIFTSPIHVDKSPTATMSKSYPGSALDEQYKSNITVAQGMLDVD